jgi:hypothetical protein
MIAPDGESNIIPHHHFMTFVTLTLHNAYPANGLPTAEEKSEV